MGQTLEKIAALSLSDMEEVSTAALFALRDFMLTDTRLLIHILNIAQRQLTDYFVDDLAKISRAFYNLGSLLYFVNKAVNMGFDFDGVIASRLALVRSPSSASGSYSSSAVLLPLSPLALVACYRLHTLRQCQRPPF